MTTTAPNVAPAPGTALPWKAVIWKHVGQADTVCVKAGEREIISWTGFDGVPCTKAEIRANARYVAKAANAYPALAAENARLIALVGEMREALESASKLIGEIDEYQKRPERGAYGVECACCMGELLDDDREVIASIARAASKAGVS